MKTITWTGSKGQTIELRARCTITMQDDVADADGDLINLGKKPSTNANLELYVDGEMIDSCWDINFWTIIDTKSGIKKIWGLPVGMSDTQAEIVDKFLKDVIDSGKSTEAIAAETAKEEAEKAERKAEAQEVISKASKYTKPLMTDAQYKVWAKNYNDVNNEGGEGYVPDLVTVEQLEYAKKVLAE